MSRFDQYTLRVRARESDSMEDAKEDLIMSLQEPAKHRVRDIGKDLLLISTGSEKPVKVKVLGYQK